MPSDLTLQVQPFGSATVEATSEIVAHGKDIALQNEIWIEPVDTCCLNLRVGIRNEGVRQAQPLRFECVLSPEGWNNVEGLLEPFSAPDDAGF